jgi:hypothetical protein
MSYSTIQDVIIVEQHLRAKVKSCVLLQLLCLVQVGELNVKIKGKFVPVHAVKAHNGNGGVAHSFLTSALDEGEWPASCIRHFTFRVCIHPLTRRLGPPRASGDILEQRKVSCSSRIQAPDIECGNGVH